MADDDIDGVPLGEEEMREEIFSSEAFLEDEYNNARDRKIAYNDERRRSREGSDRRRSNDRRHGRSRSPRSSSRRRSRSKSPRSAKSRPRSRNGERSRSPRSSNSERYSASSSHSSSSRRSDRRSRDRKERRDRRRPSFEFDDDYSADRDHEWERAGTVNDGKSGSSNEDDYFGYGHHRPKSSYNDRFSYSGASEHQQGFIDEEALFQERNEWGTDTVTGPVTGADIGEMHLSASTCQEEGNRRTRIKGQCWKDKLTSIREAHFNRSKQAPTPTQSQNQFKNDGSFLEMFKQKVAQKEVGDDKSLVTPNSIVLASSSIPFSPGLSLPPLTPTTVENAHAQPSSIQLNEDVDGAPMVEKKAVPVPVSVGKRRLAKPLKTGIVFKKPQKQEETSGSQEQLDAWSSYLKEVQKYKTSKCLDDDVSRPLVK